MNTDQDLTFMLCSCVIGIVVVYALYWFINEWSIRQKLPPGPFRLPFVGTLLFHDFTSEAFSKLSRTYGDIHTLYAGGNRFVVLNSLEVMKEALVTKAPSFSGRGQGWITLKLNPKKTGLVGSDYTNNFRQTKTIALGILRNLGFGKSIMEQKIQQELERLVQNIIDTKELPFDPNNMMLIAESNIIYNLLCGEKHGYEDDTAVKITNAVADFFKTDALVVEIFPFMRFIPKFAKEIKRMVDTHDVIMDQIREKVGQHLREHKVGQDTDLVHAYIDKHINPQTKEIDLDTDNLVYLIRDIFMGGVETSTSSMKWLVLLLANHPEVQQKAYEEIERVIGKDKVVCKEDKENLNYVEAVIWEAQRFKTVTPFAIVHYTEHDDTVAGYTIPKGTQILTNIPHVHMDAQAWGDPLQFRPERFLDSSGKFIRHSHLIPFSMGKRQCLGEVLARQKLFIFTATLIQRFCFCPPDGVHRIDEEGHLGFTYSPKPFTVRAISR